MTSPAEHSKKVLIVAGEASGDLHGANLVRAVRQLNEGVSFFGVGSKGMEEAGVNLLAAAAEISVVGATEVLTHLGAIYRVYARLKSFLREDRPDLVILIDFPDFNLLIGAQAQKLGIPILYYISPQVWAWRKGRIKKIASLVKAMLVVFPFEEPLYRNAGVDVRYVGHPLADVAVSSLSREEACKRLGLDPARRVVALLPGSRRKEIERLLPDMLGAARILRGTRPDLQFVLPLAPTVTRSFLAPYLETAGMPVMVVEGRVYDALRSADAAIVASGTATLETGLMAVPMVIVYRVSALSYQIGRLIVDAPHVGLPNIVAGKRIVPELIQGDASPDKIAAEVARVLDDEMARREVIAELLRMRELLGEGGASRKAAAVVMEFLKAPAQVSL